MSETTEEKYKRFLAQSLSAGNSDGSTEDLLAATVAFFCTELDSLRAELEARKRPLNPNRFDCPECGQGVAADEDGCCAGCGRDCDAYEDGVRVVTADREPEADQEEDEDARP